MEKGIETTSLKIVLLHHLQVNFLHVYLLVEDGWKFGALEELRVHTGRHGGQRTERRQPKQRSCWIPRMIKKKQDVKSGCGGVAIDEINGPRRSIASREWMCGFFWPVETREPAHAEDYFVGATELCKQLLWERARSTRASRALVNIRNTEYGRC